MANTLTVGQQAPDFSLQDADGRTYSKEGLAGQRFILYFYPKAATPGCTTEACDFRDNLASLTAGGFAVLGVSPDSPEELQSFAADESLTFPLLSDPDSAVAKAHGSFGEKTIGDRTVEGTLRSTFVVDESGALQLAEYNVSPDGHVRRLRETLDV
ncbi:peroxiredoxin [Brevibacterium casei]|uniref:peroxiredoxin n=1 Tax=Brevibacterium casei TaxID=33889 RepID=UPI0011A733A5|nr:peroxiredoxin [Brevibacterium casei]